jgi:type VI protein secretion system component VasK
MAVPVERMKKFRRWFGWISAVSLMVFLITFPFWDRFAEWVALGSLVSSGTTFLGWLITMFVTWRKERRESEHATIDLEKKKLELEKLREEISAKNAAAQNKRKMTKRRRGV